MKVLQTSPQLPLVNDKKNTPEYPAIKRDICMTPEQQNIMHPMLNIK